MKLMATEEDKCLEDFFTAAVHNAETPPNDDDQRRDQARESSTTSLFSPALLSSGNLTSGAARPGEPFQVGLPPRRPLTAPGRSRQPVAQAGGVSRSTDPPRASRPYVIEMKDALEFGISTMKLFPSGSRFTSIRFFDGVEIVGKKKNVARMQVLRYLQGLGLIRPIGATQADQEGRNGGWATEWEVV